MSEGSSVAAGAVATIESSKPEEEKRLHVSNIPFRYRENDLRSMFAVPT